ncbi:MAG: UDP-N-acetylmuramate--L-alanine ligase [Thermoleophilia bacterium]|nr:UDP-N-acetylmuramate--L-alanine ligase [Thermoleophilia bacterium]
MSTLAGRRLYFVGIGGSGMSAYANAARALGAEVRGWDIGDTIFLRTLDEVHIDLGGEPEVPDGWEAIVSTAHAHRVEGTPRAAFLAALVAAQPSIVVAGAHGKTTTSAMIAFVLRETGQDPSWIVGGVVPQLGGNAGAGSGWFVVEGDESDRSVFSLAPQIAVLTNVELDHHASYASEAELRVAFEEWLAGVPAVVRAEELEPHAGPLALPGAHNRANAAAALAAVVLAGVERAEAERVLAAFTGTERRFEQVGERGGVTVIDDYGHNPTELRVTLATAREQFSGRVVAVYQPHVNERTRQLHRELGAALGLADVAIVTEVTGARDAPRDGVSGRWVLAAVPDPTRRLWAPSLDDAARLALHVVRPGDVVVTFGVGEPWRIARAIVAGLPA